MVSANKLAEFKKRQKELLKSFPEDLELLQTAGISKKDINEFHSKIGPLTKNVLAKKDFLPTLIETLYNLRRGHEYSKEISNIISTENITEKQRSLLLLFSYLELTEGVFSECVQLIAFILMKNHHDIYDSFKMKFVKNYRGLDKVSLYTKLQFLEEHGFKFVTNRCDRKFRNSIAHLSIIVEDDGAVVDLTNKKRFTQDEVWVKNSILDATVLLIIHVFTKILFFQQFLPTKQSSKKTS